ncbi:uncharacterized protein LOC141642431 [Silene latifolia]|uniref:uncharacterized protein LOC141642431 n=1 Tax=Silene latifolia TaxID=37657 RepID=UPI003D77FBE4
MADAPPREIPPPPPPPFLPPDEELRQKLESQQVYIQAFLTATFIIYTIILILGRLRSRGNKNMKLCSTYSFMITAYIVSYIPGLMSAPGQSNDLYVFWMAFVAYLAAVTNEISCYSIGDNEDRKKRLIVDYGVVWPLIVGALYKSLVAPEILVPIVIIFWIVVLKLRERRSALLCATKSSNGLCRAMELISGFAKHQREAGQMNNALVGVKEARKQIAKQLQKGFRVIDYDAIEFITLDKVLGTDESFLKRTKEGKELLDTCVSFAMFWTLLAKIAGFNDVKPHVFWEGDQLLPNCFNLVEKELDFLYDYFFTNCYAIYSRGIWKKLRDLCVITLFFWLTIPLLVEYRSQDHNILYILLKGHVLDTGFTRFVIIAIITIEYAQIGVFLTSKWAKIMYTCSYLQNQTHWGTTSSTKSNLLQRLIRIACKVPRPRLTVFGLSTFTTRKVGQYSILDCYGEIPASVWCQCCIGTYIDLPRMGQAGSWDTVVPLDVTDSILDAINYCLRERKDITSGVFSLRKNEVGDDVIRTHLRNGTTQTRDILIWHIATSLFEEDAKKASTPDSYNDRDFVIASTISKYCAYLVAFLPQALPDQVYTTEREFDEAIKEFKHEALEGDEEKTKGEWNMENTMLAQATILKHKLEQHSNKWKTLADFWTEMLLFLALTDNSDALDAHVNSLCVGGEFITHVWTLLTHAGCSKEL